MVRHVRVEKVRSGLKIFEKHLHPEVVTDIRRWDKHPELSKLFKKLESIKDWERFLDHYAEAMVARYLITQGCEIAVEVATINRKSADFRVSKGSNTFFVHIKRMNFDKETQRDFNVSTRLNSLRTKGFGFLFYKSLADGEMQHFCKEANRLSEKLKDSESEVITSKTGERLGECYRRKCAQSITVYSAKDVDCSDRFSGRLKDAYGQFMPDGVNVILVTSAWRDSASIEDLQEAVNDFWSDGEHHCSDIIVWFEFDPRGESIDFELFLRENSEKPPCIVELFGRNLSKRKRFDESV